MARTGLALLAVGLLLGRGDAARAASIRYVDHAVGSDNPVCSLAEPCKEISQAVAVADAGDTIQIGEGVYYENLSLTQALTLQGAGVGRTVVDGNYAGRVVDVAAPSGAVVTLEELTLRNGRSETSGAGLRLQAGSLRLRQVEVSGSQATGGSAGGGIACTGGTLEISGTTIFNNQASGGAGILVEAGCSLSLVESTVYFNRGGYAAGLLVQGDASLSNVMVGGNVADELLSPGQARAGGIEVAPGGQASLDHCTLADNQAVGAGDGWQLWAQGAVTLRSTILYGTLGPVCKWEGDAIHSAGYNLSGDASCGLEGPGDLPGSDPQLGTLSDNGGATLSRALLRGSPAVDAAAPGDGAYDQRGMAYRDGDFDGVVRGDIGAFEYQPAEMWLPLVMGE